MGNDCTIHIKIEGSEVGEPIAKRPRIDDDVPPSSSSSSAMTTIKALSAFLVDASDYFKAILVDGQWSESQNNVIEVELPSQEGE